MAPDPVPILVRSPTLPRSQSTHLPANPAAALRPALWPSRAAHSCFIHRPSLPRRGEGSGFATTANGSAVRAGPGRR